MLSQELKIHEIAKNSHPYLQLVVLGKDCEHGLKSLEICPRRWILMTMMIPEVTLFFNFGLNTCKTNDIPC